MLIDFYLENITKGRTMLLPVTPETYSVTDDMQIETVKLASIGDINIPTFATPKSISIDGIFSTNEQRKLNTNLMPDLIIKTIDYVNILRQWKTNKDIIRVLIVPRGTIDARLDSKFYLKSIAIDGEMEMVGDIVYSIDFVEHTEIVMQEKAVQAIARPVPPAKKEVAQQNKQYTVVKGDSLWKISRKFYGKGSEYPKILNANKNKIKNKNLIYPGQVFIIPGVR